MFSTGGPSVLPGLLGRSVLSLWASLEVDGRFGKEGAMVGLRVLTERTIAKQISPPELRM